MRKNLIFVVTLIAVIGIVTSCNKDYTLLLDKQKLNFPANGSVPQTIAVTAENVIWDIEPAEGADWLSLKKMDNAIEVSVIDNTLPVAREAKFKVISNEESVKPIEITVKQNGEEGWSLFLNAYGAEHKGDDLQVGADRFVFTLDMIEYDPETYMPLNDGVVLIMDFFSETPADLMNPDIAPGVYPVTETNEPFTTRAWHTHMMVIEGGAMIGYRSSQSGNFFVEKSGEEYIFMVNLIVTDDFTQEEFSFKGYWRGEISIKNQFMSVLEEDVVLPEMVDGQVTFYGEYYWGVPAYDWEVKLWSEGIYSDEDGNIFGTGHQIDLEFLAPLGTSTTILPEGVYPLNLSMEPGTAISGHVDFMILSCWYLEMKEGMVLADGLKYAPLVTGDIIVINDGDNYIIEINATDDLGYKITGSYSGPLTYRDNAYYGAPVKQRRSSSPGYSHLIMEPRSGAAK
ncbi:BACON domain-containing protein [Bacteroidales bacterium OttesenSCG-928-K03]|nr:BACON domain-containing protein [Odoribacter sp. OttesenSCG-928-L07]MDL2242525.1 BACON domain-containing protein [Bacteroidales bacterium OttesenSCG-928-K03]